MQPGPDGSPPRPVARETLPGVDPQSAPVHPGPRPHPGGSSVPGWLATTAVVLAAGWLVGVVTVAHLVTWAVTQILVLEGTPAPLLSWPLATALATLVAVAPVGLAAVLVRRPRLAAVVRCWTVAAG
ncbi:MAG TPA: hypothetical protein VGR21_02940, partial [Cryptosporangiaceae bacterium]|nr:hypothetical protein [Cryptosporangiaceae bacterium]